MVQAGCETRFDWAAWDRFVDTCPGGTFYHRSGWLRAVAIGLGHDIRLHIVREGGEIRVGAFVRRAAKLGICAGRKPWGTGYNGVIGALGEADPFADALRAELLRVYHQVRLVQALRDWNELAAGDEAGTIYHDARWLVAVSEASCDELVLLGFYDGERLVGGLPFQVRRRAGLTLARRAFATPYSGLLRAPGLDEETLRGVVAAVETAAGQYSQFSMAFAPFASPPVFGRGWRSVERTTWLIGLEDEGTMWDSLGHALQKKIRRTARRGVRVTDDGDPQAFYGLYVSTFARRRLRPPLSRESFGRMIGRLVGEGLGRVYLASAEGRPCAARLVLFDHRRAYCALSGFDSSQAHLRAGDCLMWEVIRSVSARRDQVDLVGANLSGISEYKQKFRGELCPYVEMTRWKTTAERVLIGFHQWATRSRRGSARA